MSAATARGDRHDAKTTLVLGGTGKTGGAWPSGSGLADLPVRVGSRSATPPFDWEDPGTWPAALRGVDAVYISYYPDVAAPGARTRSVRSPTWRCRSGVRRLVLLSGRGEPEAQRCEQIVRASGAEWTVLRASWFSQNFSENFLLEPVLAGEVALPAGNVGEPFVDADDIADVAVAALTEEGHAGQLYELTGPQAVDIRRSGREIARATHRDVRYVDVPVEDYTSALESAGLPPPFVSLITYLFTEVLDGRNAWVADGVTRALGRNPRDFTDYVRRTAATGCGTCVRRRVSRCSCRPRPGQARRLVVRA